VTGRQNILHLHRMRALCDAVIVGAGTIAADDARLTTRLVQGANPLRVILDPTCRLGAHHRVFTDGVAPTLLVCARGRAARGRAPPGLGCAGGVDMLELGGDDAQLDVRELIHALHERGCRRLFVEGGGTTVSRFLCAGVVDQLQITLAPLLIGSGRRGIRLPPRDRLADCPSLQSRVFVMGEDVMLDCRITPLTQASTRDPHARR
jgi:riboflavin-specific deaminase-like protein